MDKIILISAGSGWFYECVGPKDTVVHTHGRAEALFWHLLGYAARHTCYRAS